ncbi:AAA family ATPase [Chloroflexi bacterium TSY]|nr:AAA family ATPase [Chloroflexi bacterium TSY]
MALIAPLKPEQLCANCDPTQLDFDTTDELDDLTDFIGQERAIEAIRFGVSIQRSGYNIFALGPSGTGKYTLVHQFVQSQAANEPVPDDWCYVNNFDQSHKPNALRLPPGMARQFRNDMSRLIDDLQTGLSSALESEEYQTRRQVLGAEFRERQQESLQTLQNNAQERGLTLLQTPAGFAFAPVKDGNVIAAEDFQKLPDEERKRLEGEISALQTELQAALQQVPRWERELRSRIRDLNREVTGFVIQDAMTELRNAYSERSNMADYLDGVNKYLDAVQNDITENLRDFLAGTESGDPSSGASGGPAVSDQNVSRSAESNPALRRYQVNVLVHSGDSEGAPVFYESNPNYLNLVGRVEQMAQMGALITDFTLIKPGRLHQANGGYLLLDAQEVVSQPYAWVGLKRALEFEQIRIESPTQMMSLTSTVSLEPEPIPLDIKVILLGDRMIYYLLSQSDPDFNELFKVEADFSEVVERTPENQMLYARMIATIIRREKLLPFDKSAIGRVIDHSSRLVADSERLTMQVQAVVDLMEEASHWAAVNGSTIVTAEHVQQALDAKIFRADRTRERMEEQVLRETILIDTSGAKVGQINGLAVLQLGNFAFGRVSRITARVRIGKGEVVDIEREVAMSGPLHSKGVLILSSFLTLFLRNGKGILFVDAIRA